jgi:hypothetical protein
MSLRNETDLFRVSLRLCNSLTINVCKRPNTFCIANENVKKC